MKIIIEVEESRDMTFILDTLDQYDEEGEFAGGISVITDWTRG